MAGRASWNHPMRRVGILLAFFALSGCLGGADPTPAPPGGAATCDLDYPDETPFDCSTSQVTKPAQATPPALNSGWSCVVHLVEDGSTNFFDLFAHSDGRAGIYWDFKMDREGGFGYVEGSIYYTKGGQALVVPYQPKGFAIFPQKPQEQTVEVHLLLRHFLLDIQEDGVWVPAPNATIIVGSMGGHPWYVWNFDGPNGNQYFDLIVNVPDDETRRQYSPQKRYLETEDLTLFATVWSRGFKSPNRSLTPDPLRQTGCSNVSSQIPV